MVAKKRAFYRQVKNLSISGKRIWDINKLLRQRCPSGLPFGQSLLFETLRERAAPLGRSLILLSLLFLLSVAVPPVVATVTESTPIVQTQSDALQLVQQAKRLYEVGQYEQAVRSWQQVVETFAAKKDTLNQAMALSNLSLTYQQLGEWDRANQTLTESLNLLQTQSRTPEQLRILAQTNDILGQLQLATGRSQDAIDTWQQAADIYAQIANPSGMTQSRINQAHALQELGLYPKACKTLLETLELSHQTCEVSPKSLQTLKTKPATSINVLGLRSLGDVLRVMGTSEQSKLVLEEGLKLAQQLNSPQDIAATYLSLGNTTRVLANSEALDRSEQTEYRKTGLNYYERAAELSPSLTTRILAQLNQLSLLLDDNQWQDAKQLALSLKSQLRSLPPNRTGIYAQINFAQSLIKLGNRDSQNSQLKIQNSNVKNPSLSSQSQNSDSQFPTFGEIDEILATAAKQANSIGDKRTEAYANGLRGKLYELNQQWLNAENFTKQALNLAPTYTAPDLAYQFFWQMGRLRQAQDDNEGAIANYSQAVETLQSLRSDLVTISSDVQFSFRESVEPIYRELVALLLQPSSEKISQKNLDQARKVIESLQLAELDNFFRDACSDTKPTQIDQIDKTAAVFYPIILPDRLEVILALPGQPLRQYTTRLPQQEIDKTLQQLRDAVTVPRYRIAIKRFLEPAQQVYDWLIRPVEAELANSGVKTLAFVPDGAFRNIPLSGLYDGKQYLVEKYSIAIAPGLQLVDPQPLARQKLQVLAFGLSEERQGFSPLPNVQSELERIKTQVESQVRINESFTSSKFKQDINSIAFPVIHLATHGQFSSSAEDTFVLTWDDRIKANDFNELLRTQEGKRKRPIELLVLSACQTAAGDNRAALGLAGVAVRAGARSTLASLWFVSDEATSLLMTQFYKELNNPQVTKAEALRRAQTVILQNQTFKHPYFWSAFVLVGNWL
jgi:CHAT domain-containing protein